MENTVLVVNLAQKYDYLETTLRNTLIILITTQACHLTRRGPNLRSRRRYFTKHLPNTKTGSQKTCNSILNALSRSTRALMVVGTLSSTSCGKFTKTNGLRVQSFHPADRLMRSSVFMLTKCWNALCKTCYYRSSSALTNWCVFSPKTSQ